MTSRAEEATLDEIVTWDCIDWNHVKRIVNRLQLRIAKAVRDDNRHLVRRLQYLLKNSFYAKLLAVHRVTSNKGKRTPGIDGVLWKTPRQKLQSAKKLTSYKYRANPLKRTYIAKKGKNKKRPLGIPTMHDRTMQALYALTLEPIAESTADKVSFGFRKYRSAQDAAVYAFKCLVLRDRAQWILEGDIKGCFDHINHEWLMKHIPIEKKILREFLSSGYSYRNKLFPTNAGTPQGGIISPILANMTLDGMEKVIKEQYWASSTGHISVYNNKHKVNLIRYADDFIVTAKSKEVAENLKNIIVKFLIDRGLTLSEEKTKITHIKEGFDFLGWNFRKYHDKLLIKPSKGSCKNIAEKVRYLIKKNRATAQDDLIRILNPVIRGWCNYHRSMVSKEAFINLDTVLFWALWKWAVYRHPNKNGKWLKNRYWKHIGTRDWRFSSGDITLILAGRTKIIRHNMIKRDKNPFLKEHQEYFQLRKVNRKRYGSGQP